MYGAIAVKLIVGMVGVLFFLRIVGKTQLAQVTPLDTVSAFVVGALVGGVIYNPDMDIFHLLYAILVWTMFDVIIRYCMRFRIVRKIVTGDAVYIVKDGRLNIRVFRRNGLEMEQFRTLLRENGVFSMFDVDDIRFETNGKITISKKGDTQESYLFVNNGGIVQSSLDNAKKTEKWLDRELKKIGCTEISQLFCVEWTPDKGFYVVSRDGKIFNGDFDPDDSDKKGKSGSGNKGRTKKVIDTDKVKVKVKDKEKDTDKDEVIVSV